MRHLQPNSRGALVGLVVVLLVHLGLTASGRGGFSLPVLAGFVFAASCLVLWSEYQAGRRG